ncbi:MAG TPA: hypothetical protein VJJ28_02665 [Candidatus Paceibacterota bacterium]
MIKAKRKLYILPGWGHRLSDKNYQELISIAVAKQYQIVSLKVSTRNRKYSLGSEKGFLEIIEKIKNQIIRPCSNDTILGFSVGAIQAYGIAIYLKMHHVILCSMSPILGDDLSFYSKREVADLSKIQYAEMSKINYPPLTSKKATLFYGEKESDILKKRSIILGKRKGYKTIEIKNCGHELSKIYLEQIQKVL